MSERQPSGLICDVCTRSFEDCSCTDRINVWTIGNEVELRLAAVNDNGRLCSITQHLTPAHARVLATHLVELADIAETPPKDAA